jgi:hypothetical protein
VDVSPVHAPREADAGLFDGADELSAGEGHGGRDAADAAAALARQAPGMAKLLEGKRIAGEKMVVPNDVTKSEISSLGLSRIQGTFRVCLDETGTVESVLPMRSTGFASYDARILATIRTWRYSPYMINDEPVPVCTAVTFIYTQSSALFINQRSR